MTTFCLLWDYLSNPSETIFKLLRALSSGIQGPNHHARWFSPWFFFSNHLLISNSQLEMQIITQLGLHGSSHLCFPLTWFCFVEQQTWGYNIRGMEKNIFFFLLFTSFSKQQIFSSVKFSVCLRLEEISTLDLYIAAKAWGATKF